MEQWRIGVRYGRHCSRKTSPLRGKERWKACFGARVAALAHRSRKFSPLIERGRFASPIPAAYAADRLDIQRLTLRDRRPVSAAAAMIATAQSALCTPTMHAADSTASTAPENPHLWLTGGRARIPVRLLPCGLFHAWAWPASCKRAPARGPRKHSPFAQRNRRARPIGMCFSPCTATTFFITSTIAVLRCAGRWAKNASSW